MSAKMSRHFGRSLASAQSAGAVLAENAIPGKIQVRRFWM